MTKAKLSNFRTQARNANKHTERGLGMLEKSIKADGWIGAMTVAADGETFDGSARLEVLADAMPSAEPIVVESDGTRPVIVRRTDIASADDPRAVRLGLGANRIAQVDYAVDPDVLASLAGEVDLSQFWSKDELADLLKGMGGNDAEDPGAQVDKAAELQAKWGTALGQLWAIGRHRLLVGDCTVAANVARLMGGEKAVLMFADPPYGVEYDAEWWGEAGHATMGKNRTGKVEADDRSDWTEAWRLFNSQVLYCWHASAFSEVVKKSLVDAGYDVRQQIIWAKTIPIMSRSAYHWQHEPCWYAVRHGSDGHWIGDRTQTTLWTEPPPNHIMANSKDDKTPHPTQKPIALAERAIRNHAGVDDVVVDPFLGSGTTMVAAERLGRKCFAMEIDPNYCGVILERMSGMGLSPALVE